MQKPVRVMTEEEDRDNEEESLREASEAAEFRETQGSAFVQEGSNQIWHNDPLGRLLGCMGYATDVDKPWGDPGYMEGAKSFNDKNAPPIYVRFTREYLDKKILVDDYVINGVTDHEMVQEEIQRRKIMCAKNDYFYLYSLGEEVPLTAEELNKQMRESKELRRKYSSPPVEEVPEPEKEEQKDVKTVGKKDKK